MKNKLMQRVRRDKKGFTLAELLVVVAIIAVLVAIAIPTFSGALEKSRKAVDQANVRAAYAEWMVDKMSADDYQGEKLIATSTEATTYFKGKYDFKSKDNVSVAVDAEGVWTPSSTAASGGGGAG